MMVVRVVGAVVAGAAAVAAVGCGTTAAPQPPPPPVAEASDPTEVMHPLGGPAFTTAGGGTLNVGAPRAFVPSNKSDRIPSARFWDASMTFTNGGSKGTFEPSGWILSASAGGVECERYFQTDQPDTPVLPGKSITWQFEFECSAPQGAELLVSIGHSDSENRYLFSGALP